MAETVVTIVDGAGVPVQGARIDWQQGAPWACDNATRISAAYVRTGAGTTDALGRVTLPRGIGNVGIRAVAPGGDAVITRISASASATLVVSPTATIAIAPTCDGRACRDLEAFGTLTLASASCPIQPPGAARDGRIVLADLQRGAIELHLRAGANTADERAAIVRATIGDDATLAPELPRIAGDETLRGHIELDRAPPGGPDYATTVVATCGELVRSGVVDATAGTFVIEHLPARPCTLHAESDARPLRWERELQVRPGTDVTIVLEPQHS